MGKINIELVNSFKLQKVCFKDICFLYTFYGIIKLLFFFPFIYKIFFLGMLNGWIQKLKQIKSSRPGSLKSGRSGRKPQFPNIEKQLFNLYNNQVSNNKIFSNNKK